MPRAIHNQRAAGTIVLHARLYLRSSLDDAKVYERAFADAEEPEAEPEPKPV